jgi:hypothetical protein
MIVTLPFVLLLLDRWPLKRGSRVLEKLPLFAMAAAASIVTYMVQRGGGAVVNVPLRFRVENALISYLAYGFDYFFAGPARGDIHTLRPSPAGSGRERRR